MTVNFNSPIIQLCIILTHLHIIFHYGDSMKETKDIKPTLEQIEIELKATYAAAAVVMDECFCNGAGKKLLGISDDTSLRWSADFIDLSKTNIGRYLPIFYAYAYDGRLIPGYEHEFDMGGEHIERLQDFMLIFHSDSAYFDLCLEVAGIDPVNDTGYIDDMLERLSARNALDSGNTMSLEKIAILADMNERSVKNALAATGENRLSLNEQGSVDNADALRWLKNRRGFKPTVRTSFSEEIAECPEELDAIEIPSFVEHRIGLLFSDGLLDTLALSHASTPSTEGAFVEYPEIFQRVSKASGLTPESIQNAIQQPLKIRPEECQGLAKALAVDPVWFTMQVMRALFPTQMDMLLNPSHYNGASDDAFIEGTSVDVILTPAMIEHGYIDIPSHAKGLFPADCFGSRKEGDVGAIVVLHYGGKAIASDIRIKSAQTISPRKRFTTWLQKEISAAPGDRVRFTRIDDRDFELTHFPK